LGFGPQWIQNHKLSAQSRAALRTIDLNFHDLRHEAGSRMLEAGWPLHHIQQMLGHADLKQTSAYLNVTRTWLQESMRRFGLKQTSPIERTLASTPAMVDRSLQ
jgi:site-specific recombinase XerD